MGVRAADGQTALVGGEYASSSDTRITTTQNSGSALAGVHTGKGNGVAGQSSSEVGVLGSGARAGASALPVADTISWCG